MLSLKSGIDIPSDLEAGVHSQSAIGEQYVLLLPRNATSPPLKNGDVIPLADTSVPPDINTILAQVVTGLKAVPKDNLKTAIDESYTAVGGLGPEAEPDRQGLNRSVDRGAQESRPADRADRPIEAGARFADQHVRCDSGVGVEPGNRDQMN